MLRQELNAELLAANSAGQRADAVTWLDLGLERLTGLGGALGRPLGGPLAAYTALIDLSAAANQLTCMQGTPRHCTAGLLPQRSLPLRKELWHNHAEALQHLVLLKRTSGC